MGTDNLLPRASSYPEVYPSARNAIREPLIQKPKVANRRSGVPEDNQYDGRIEDVAMDGSVDYKGRPANKRAVGRWKAVWYIMGAVVLERLAYYGISFNLISYLTNALHEGTAESLTNVWTWGGVVWILPLLTGLVADAYLGRYLTIMYSMSIYLAGMLLLTLSVSLPSLKPPECPTHTDCKNASKWQVGVFYFALYVIAVGVAGVKPCFSSLGADQFDEEDETERPMKRSFFNYWWVAVTGGSLLAVTVLVYIEDRVGFGWGYGIPTVGLAIATAVLLLGTRTYRFKRPMGSPLTQVARVLTAAFHKYNVNVPEDPNLLHEVVTPEKRNLHHTDHLRFFDKAATPMRNPTGGDDDASEITKESNWRLCTVTQVEEVKLLVRVMPVWLTTLMFMVTVQQMSTVFLKQGLTMDQSMGPNFKIPPASLELTTTITALTLIPLYDLYLVPLVRSFTGNERGLSLLQRMGTGLIITVLGTAIAACVEMKRLKVIKDYGLEESTEPLPMSIFWLTPQYCVMGIAQVFAYMGQLEFFYDQVPDGMETIGTALFTSNTGVAHFLCTFILQIITSVTSRGGRQPWIISNINESRLDKYYWLLSTLSLINFMAYFAVSIWYTYKATERNVRHRKVVPEEPPVVE